jgi:hypothetical protein
MKTPRTHIIILASLVALFSLSANSSQALITIQPDAADGQDAWVGSGSPDTNHGNDSNLFFGNDVTVGEQRHLYIKFDLSDVPEGTFLTDATVDFYMHGQNGWMSYTYGVYPVLEPWDEQTITWNNVPQTAENAVLTFEGSRWQGNWEQWHSIFNFGGLAQSWLYDPSSNHGFMIKAVSSYYGEPYIYSSDSDEVVLRPRIILNSGTVPVEASSLGSVKALFR